MSQSFSEKVKTKINEDLSPTRNLTGFHLKVVAAIAIICPNSVESSSPNNFALNPNDVGAIALPTAKPAWIGSLKIIHMKNKDNKTGVTTPHAAATNALKPIFFTCSISTSNDDCSTNSITPNFPKNENASVYGAICNIGPTKTPAVIAPSNGDVFKHFSVIFSKNQMVNSNNAMDASFRKGTVVATWDEEDGGVTTTVWFIWLILAVL